MRPTTIRRIDYWMGVPLCFLLTLWRQITGDRALEATTKIVFLKLIEQGATVLARDAIERAVAMVGRNHVYFCVFESNRAILDVMDLVPPANVLIIRDRQLLSCVLDFLRVFRTLRQARVDTSVDMEFFSRASAICAFLSGAAKRVGLHRFSSELPYRGDLMTHRVQYTPYLHVSVQYSLLAMAIDSDPAQLPLLKVQPPDGTPSSGAYQPFLGYQAGLSTTPSGPFRRNGPLEVSTGHSTRAPAMFVPTEQERRVIRDALSRETAATWSPVVLLNPNASDLLPLRKWPSDRFAELARRVLTAYPNALVVLTGAPSERSAAEALCRTIDSARVVSLAGRTTLRELLTLYTMADILVTNDSGPAHFATLTPVAVVVLFGPETPALFGPLSSTARVIWKQLACSPCVSVFNHRFSPCTDNVCMQLIEVSEVFQAVAESLAASRHAE